MTTTHDTILVPVETQVREFDSKLLFACVAAEKGFRAVLGSQTKIHQKADSLPRGIYLTKDARSSKVRMLNIFNSLGHEIVGWDEEGLVRYPSQQYFKLRLSAEALKRVSAWFAWGREDAEILTTFAGYPGFPIHVTGNPRFDMLRREVRPFYGDAAERLNDRFGRFLLINTNFGHSNHFLPNQTVTVETVKAKQNGDTADWEYDLSLHRDTLFARFQAMVPALAKAFADTTIILRPHPAEGHEVWQKAAAGCDNVQVIHEGSVIPWIMASDAVVHNGCTTAVEAYMLDRPAVTYKPIVSERFDRHLPDGLSSPAFNIEQLIEKVEVARAASPDATDAAKEALLERHLAPRNGRLASDQITEIIAGSAAQRPGEAVPSKERFGAILKSRGRAAQKIANSLVPGSKNWTVYEKHRFPGVSHAEVEERITRLQGLLGRFEKVQARQVSEGIFALEH